MTETWRVDGPRVIDVGGEQERVRKVIVAIVGGHVDLVAHSPAAPEAHGPDAAAGADRDLPAGGPHGARVQVSSVHGLPLRVSWDGSTLKVMHGKESEESVLDALKRLIGSLGAPTAVVTVSVPAQCRASVSTLTASVLASGLHRGITVNTVSGEATVNDIAPTLTLHTVSGAADCAGLSGEARISTVSGEVTVHSSALERAVVNTVSGDVALDLTDGHVTVRSSSVSGDVTVRAPLSGYAVEAATASGQVVVDGVALHRPDEGCARTARAGDESTIVKANSMSGNVVVLRAAPQDATTTSADQAADHDPRAPADPGPQDSTDAAGARGPWGPPQPPGQAPPTAPPAPPEPPSWPSGDSPWAGQVDDPQESGS